MGEWLQQGFQADTRLVLEILVKMGVGVILAGAIGWERELHGRPAGIRTHMLMALGVILFSEVSRGFSPDGDPGRIAAQIVTGVGFLGAGTIMRLGAEIKGLTTAASIWATAGIGMAVSAGGSYFLVAVIGTLFALITLSLVDRFERRVAPTAHPKRMLLRISSLDVVSRVLDALSEKGCQVGEVQIVRADSETWIQLTVSAQEPNLIAVLLSVEGVLSTTRLD